MSLGILATDGVVCPAVREVFSDLSIEYSLKNPQAILVWYDTIDYHSDLRYSPESTKSPQKFRSLRPHQVINRIPGINILCRKHSLAQILRRAQYEFRNNQSLFSFSPPSFLLGGEYREFLKEFVSHVRTYVVKTDNGSLGVGTTVLGPKDHLPGYGFRGIAQDCVESFTLDGRIFDFRLYVLVASVSPLRIYVYRDGLARFCADKADGNGEAKYRTLTNTAVNRGRLAIDKLTRTVSEVMERLEKEHGKDVAEIWGNIDEAIVLTIMSGYDNLLAASSHRLPKTSYSRAFQILGFDVMLDVNCKPAILEVNHRPSLESDTDYEHTLKREMLADAIRVAVPLGVIQKAVIDSPKFDPAKVPAETLAKAAPPTETGFRLLFDSRNPAKPEWKRVMDTVAEMGAPSDTSGVPTPRCGAMPGWRPGRQPRLKMRGVS
jgi:hypothetical protein